MREEQEDQRHSQGEVVLTMAEFQTIIADAAARGAVIGAAARAFADLKTETDNLGDSATVKPDEYITDDKLAEALESIHPAFAHDIDVNMSIMLRTTAALTLAARDLGDLSELPALAKADPQAARAKINLLGRVATTCMATEALTDGDFADAATQLYTDLLMEGFIADDLTPLDLPTEDEAKAILGLTASTPDGTAFVPPPAPDAEVLPHSNS